MYKPGKPKLCDTTLNLLIQDVTLKVCIFEPILVKPKCVLETKRFVENCKQTAKDEQLSRSPKRILALPIC